MQATLSLTLIALLVSAAQAQSSGHVEGNSFVDNSLHFAYSPPQRLQFVPFDSLNLGTPKTSAACYALFAARQQAQPYGIIAFTQKLNTPCDPGGSKGYKNGAEFLSRIQASVGPGFKALGSKHTILPNGFIIDELDYMAGPEFSSGIALNVGSFLVLFKCNADSASDLATMTKSIFAIRKID